MIIISKLIFIIVSLMLFSSIFIPIGLGEINKLNTEDIKQDLNLSARVLINSIDEETYNFEDISEGEYIPKEVEINIDKEKLLNEFYDVLFKNIENTERFEKVKNNIPIKVLVYYDRFYVIGHDDEWSTPYFFSVNDGGVVKYINTRNTDAYYIDEGIEIQTSIDRNIRDKAIIDRVNEVVSAYTNTYIGDRYSDSRLTIEIQNPSDVDISNTEGMNQEEMNMFFEKYRQQKNFNILDEITFFVIYFEEDYVGIRNNEIIFENYNVVGYTLDMDRLEQD